MERAPVAVSVENATKKYGECYALRDVSISVEAGTIHAFVGENGAGKSTLLGSLAGRVALTSGRVLIDGAPLAPGSPRAARAAGVSAIYQELTIVPALSAMDNVFLGATMSRRGLLARRRMEAEFERLAVRLGVELEPDVRSETLSVANQQLLEIMRALHAGTGIVVLDEPTAALASTERASLFALMRSLRRDGVTMVFVSHNLDEVLDIADHVTVFRDGQVAADGPVDEWSRPSLISAMLGPAATVLNTALGATGDPHSEPPGGPVQPTVLTVRSLRVPGVIDDVSFDVHEGEILGIAGLVGSGRTTTLRALAGLMHDVTGELTVRGRRTRCPRNVRAALDLAIALVPEDRKREGLVLGLSSVPNITMSDLRSVCRWGWVNGRRRRRAAESAAKRFALEPAMMRRRVGALSGGNQQKVLLARWSHRVPAVLLVDEPGRGIDIGAKAHVLGSLRGMADSGSAVVIVSSETEELLAIADRIIVLRHGRVVTELDNRARGVDEHQILTAAFASEAA